MLRGKYAVYNKLICLGSLVGATAEVLGLGGWVVELSSHTDSVQYQPRASTKCTALAIFALVLEFAVGCSKLWSLGGRQSTA